MNDQQVKLERELSEGVAFVALAFAKGRIATDPSLQNPVVDVVTSLLAATARVALENGMPFPNFERLVVLSMQSLRGRYERAVTEKAFEKVEPIGPIN